MLLQIFPRARWVIRAGTSPILDGTTGQTLYVTYVLENTNDLSLNEINYMTLWDRYYKEQDRSAPALYLDAKQIFNEESVKSFI